MGPGLPVEQAAEGALAGLGLGRQLAERVRGRGIGKRVLGFAAGALRKQGHGQGQQELVHGGREKKNIICCHVVQYRQSND